MTQVSGHYRNGRWVRPHHRRSTPRAMQGTGQVRVRAHRREDGTYVRSHWRSVSPAPASTSGTSDWDWIWYLLVALLVLGALGALGVVQ